MISIESIAEELNIEVALLLAVKEVESGGRDGFLDNGRPQILFEGHVMYRELSKKFPKLDMKDMCNRYPDIIYPKWDRSKYLKPEGEWFRLNTAIDIDTECGYKSASWGMFQIMGFNYKACGCKSVEEFVNCMYDSKEEQIRLMGNFMKNNHMLEPLRDHNWAKFALRYNGPGYRANHYDEKLAKAYEKFK